MSVYYTTQTITLPDANNQSIPFWDLRSKWDAMKVFYLNKNEQTSLASSTTKKPKGVVDFTQQTKKLEEERVKLIRTCNQDLESCGIKAILNADSYIQYKFCTLERRQKIVTALKMQTKELIENNYTVLMSSENPPKMSLEEMTKNLEDCLSRYRTQTNRENLQTPENIEPAGEKNTASSYINDILAVIRNNCPNLEDLAIRIKVCAKNVLELISTFISKIGRTPEETIQSDIQTEKHPVNSLSSNPSTLQDILGERANGNQDSKNAYPTEPTKIYLKSDVDETHQRLKKQEDSLKTIQKKMSDYASQIIADYKKEEETLKRVLTLLGIMRLKEINKQRKETNDLIKNNICKKNIECVSSEILYQKELLKVTKLVFESLENFSLNITLKDEDLSKKADKIATLLCKEQYEDVRNWRNSVSEYIDARAELNKHRKTYRQAFTGYNASKNQKTLPETV